MVARVTKEEKDNFHVVQKDEIRRNFSSGDPQQNRDRDSVGTRMGRENAFFARF